jgi:glycosyltransferase involved in cell wall biosynthesis
MEQKKINIIVPFYNCEKYIELCLNSILTQKYNNYHVYVINDASTDNSDYIVKNAIKDNDRVTYIVNEYNKTALENIIFILNNYLEEDAIYCIVDGDDFLLSNKVNQHISDIFNFGIGGENKIISDEELKSYPKSIRQTNKVLFSYGSASWSNGNKCFSRPYSKDQFDMIKKQQFQVSHLRCFLGIVWKEMISQCPDLSFAKDDKKRFYLSGYDTILCIPMLQICGYEHTFHNSKPIYYYRLHENNDHVKDQSLQWYVHKEALNKTPFKKLEIYE